MFETLPRWYDAETILRETIPALVSRYTSLPDETRRVYNYLNSRGIKTALIHNNAIEISSSELRAMFKNRLGSEYLTPKVYEEIIRRGFYGAKADFDWLRYAAYSLLDEKRIRHVAGCEAEAVALAKRWRVSEDEAREAAILHDITKNLDKDAHAKIIDKYVAETDEIERINDKLLHSKTGALLAKYEFNVNDAVMNAILWHTTGKPNMTPLEMIIYIADYIEPNRKYDEIWFAALRRLAYENLREAMKLGLQKSIEDLSERGKPIHPNSQNAYDSILCI